MSAPPPPSTPLLSPVRWPFFYGWVIVAGAFITMGIGVNTRTAFSLLFPPIVTEFGWERGVTAGAFSAGFMASTLVAPFLGMLMDRVEPRVVMPLGAILISSGMGLATLIRHPWHLYLTLGILVVGGSVFFSYIGHALFLPHWFVRKRGLAIGIAFSGVGMGSILLLPWLQRLIGQTGWRYACLSLAVLLLVTLLPLNLILPRRRPEDVGLAPDGDQPLDSTSEGTAGWPMWWTRPGRRRTGPWGKRSRPRAFGGSASPTMAGSIPGMRCRSTRPSTSWISVSPERAAFALGLVGLTGVIGQIALGHLSDRLGREWAWTLSGLGFFLCYATLLVLPASPQPLLLYGMVEAQGLLGYGLASVFGAIPAEVFPGKHYGTIFGTLNMASSAGAACGPWITGLLYDTTGTYGRFLCRPWS